MKKLLFSLAALTVCGCGPTFVYRSAGLDRPAKPPTCDFAVVTAPPSEPHQKLGSFVIQYDNTGFLDNAEQLKKKIRPDVCKVGGDVIEGHANSYGTYTKVTVYALEAAAPAPSADVEESAGDESSASAAEL